MSGSALIRAVTLVASGNLFGKVVGVAREMVLAGLFGTSPPVAAYRVAQAATFMPINFLTADSLNAAFVPLYARYRREAPEKAATLFVVLLVIFSMLALGISLFLYVAASLWVRLLAPGFDLAASTLAAELLRIMAFGVPPYLLGMLLAYVEVAEGRYTLVSIRPTIQSLGLILGTVTAFAMNSPRLLSWGFTIAYVVFLAWGIVRLVEYRSLLWPMSWSWPTMREVSASFWNATRHLMLLPLILQSNIALERSIASLLGVSVVAGLDFARFIIETCIHLLAVPLGLAGLTFLGTLRADQVRAWLQRVVPPVVVAAVPLSVFFVAHGEAVVALLYQRGKFDAASTQLSWSILWGMALGLWAQIVAYVLVKVLNAQLRNREAVRNMAFALAANAIVNVLFFRMLGPVTLGLGNSAYAVVLLGLTMRSLGLTGPIMYWAMRLLPGVVVYLAVARMVPEVGVVWLDLSCGLLLCFAFWGTYCWAIPELRRILRSMWRGVVL